MPEIEEGGLGRIERTMLIIGCGLLGIVTLPMVAGVLTGLVVALVNYSREGLFFVSFDDLFYVFAAAGLAMPLGFWLGFAFGTSRVQDSREGPTKLFD